MKADTVRDVPADETQNVATATLTAAGGKLKSRPMSVAKAPTRYIGKLAKTVMAIAVASQEADVPFKARPGS